MPKERNGYVFKDKQGTWYARITVTDSTGKRRNIKRTAKDKREARQTLKNLVRWVDEEGSKAIDVSRMTFNDLADFYVAHYCKPAEYSDGKKVGGLRDVERAQGFLVRFREQFGKRRLSEITYGDIHTYRAMRLKAKTHYERPPTIASMNRELGVLRRILNIGVREGWLPRNPINAGEPLVIPSAERRRERILTIEEERRLLAECDQLLSLFAICLLDTGARRSEILQLRWRSLCFATRTITIEAMTTKTLKTRQVSMTERMYCSLFRCRELAAQNPDDAVFGTAARTITRAFAKACGAAGINYGSPHGITLHSLRHTAATRLVKGQMPIQMVGRILGHSQPHTTYRYLTANSETMAQAANILDAFQATENNGTATTPLELVN